MYFFQFASHICESPRKPISPSSSSPKNIKGTELKEETPVKCPSDCGVKIEDRTGVKMHVHGYRTAQHDLKSWLDGKDVKTGLEQMNIPCRDTDRARKNSGKTG